LRIDGITSGLPVRFRFPTMKLPKYTRGSESHGSRKHTMPILASICDSSQISSLREEYRDEMQCQIIHDSIHERPGWSVEYVLEMDGAAVGYGSVAIGGPWKTAHSLYEFYVKGGSRQHIFDLFSALRAKCNVSRIETQTNDPFLSVMLHTFAENVQAEAILFEDQFETRLQPEGAGFRPREERDVDLLKALELDDTAGWVATLNGSIAGAGGILYHYNRPYGDIYMKIAEPFQGKGIGAYLVQELKKACRAGGNIPAARCNIKNLASRRTLQKAGFVPCGNLVSGDFRDSNL
jgi:GNAT superfamily N-acetyltransferase